MNNHKTSKDYKRLKELLDRGCEVVCFFDLHTGPHTLDSHHQILAKKEKISQGTRTVDAYKVVGYWVNQTESLFIRGCKSYCVEFIDKEDCYDRR